MIRSIRSSPLRLLGGVLAVLAIATVAFVLRGSLGGDGDDAPPIDRLPGTTTTRTTSTSAGAQTFTPDLLARNASPKGTSTIATTRKRSVRVYARPRAAHPRTLRQRVFNGQHIPLTFLVADQRPGWVHVDLPTRPNQSRGWIRRDQVELTFTRLTIDVDPGHHRLRLRDGRRTVLSTKIAVGRSLSPTPPGRYFVTDLIKPADPDGFYGPYALGLSAHSTVYTSFAGGDGQVGIHGTNQPSVIGTDVSHGCIRVPNAAIRELAKRVPLGTPVVIERRITAAGSSTRRKG